MFYSERRKLIKSGDLVTWDSRRVSGVFDGILKLIGKIKQGRYTHVGVVLDLGGRVFCVEATPPAVRIIPLSMLGDFYHIPVDIKRWPSRYTEHLLKHIGKPYSLNGYLKEVFGIAKDNDNFYCSELVADFYKSIGLIDDAACGLDPDIIVDYISDITGNEPVFVSVDPGNIRE